MTLPQPRRYSLRQAVSVVFVLTTILPLLIFTYTLYRLNGFREIQAQITLGLALVTALIGFHVLRTMVGRASDLLRTVNQATEQREVPPPVADKELRVPGIGTIQEFHEVAKTVDEMWATWKVEAERYVGQRVLVSVRNSSHPIPGTLVEVADDGVLLEADGEPVAVSYRRVSGIKPLTVWLKPLLRNDGAGRPPEDSRHALREGVVRDP